MISIKEYVEEVVLAAMYTYVRKVIHHLEQNGFAAARNLGPVHTGADPLGSGPKLEWIGLACTRDLLYPIQFGSAIRTSLGRIE